MFCAAFLSLVVGQVWCPPAPTYHGPVTSTPAYSGPITSTPSPRNVAPRSPRVTPDVERYPDTLPDPRQPTRQESVPAPLTLPNQREELSLSTNRFLESLARVRYEYENVPNVKSRGWIEGRFQLNSEWANFWVPMINGELPSIQAHFVEDGSVVKFVCDYSQSRPFTGDTPAYPEQPSEAVHEAIQEPDDHHNDLILPGPELDEPEMLPDPRNSDAI